MAAILNNPNYNDLMEGQVFIYPGHFALIAYFIVNQYSSFEEANQGTPSGFPKALAEPSIPGAGGEVYMALNFLKDIVVDGKDAEETFLEYHSRWKAGGHTKNIESSKEQGAFFWKKLKPMLEMWK